MLYLFAALAFSQDRLGDRLVDTFMPHAPARPYLTNFTPKPSGKNGYEDYLAAADAVDSEPLKSFYSWKIAIFDGGKPRVPDPPGLSASSPRAEILHREAQLAAQVVALVHAGGTKPVYDHRRLGYAELPFPEYAAIKLVAKVALDSATDAFNSGDPSRGTQILLDSYLMGRKVGARSVIAYLVGGAIEVMTLKVLSDQQAAMTLSDWQKVRTFARRLLAEPRPEISALDEEVADSAVRCERTLAQMAAEKDGGADTAPIRNSTPASRKEAVELFRTVATQSFASARQRFAGPEYGWNVPIPTPPDPPEPKNPSLTNYSRYAGSSMASLTPDFVKTAARYRTQLHVLEVTAAVHIHRLKTGRWPGSLRDAAISPIDPLTRKPYLYTKNSDGSFEVKSVGTKDSGPIGLIYRRPKK